MKTLQDFNFKNQKAVIRVDFNVPLDENFHVTDTTRIEAAKPTIDKILNDLIEHFLVVLYLFLSFLPFLPFLSYLPFLSFC